MSQPPTGHPTAGPAEPGPSSPAPASRVPRHAAVRDALRLLRTAGPSTAAPLLLVSGAAVGAFSVSAYHRRVVVSYLVLVVGLAVMCVRGLRRPAYRPGPTAARTGAVLALLGAGVLIWTVPAFSYVTGDAGTALRGAGAVTALAAGAVLAGPGRHAPALAFTVCAAGYAAVAAGALRLDPAPRIDVWYTLQGAADGLLQGQDMYRQVWIGPPGPMPAFTYLPWTAMLLAPGRWLFGDVRWTLTAITLATAVMLRALPRDEPPGRRIAATGAACLVLLLPGTLTQVEQAWTEPLLLGCLTLAVLGLSRGRGAVAVLGVALALASKQHVLLLLPVLAAWPRFGVRRAAASAGLAGLLVLPWFLAGPGELWHDTVTLLVHFQPLRFADTLYIALLNEWGVQLPFWLTGAAVAGVVAASAGAVRRADPQPAVLLRWCALVLFVANLVNKQAFYNQYWLVAGLVLLSWAVPADLPGRRAPDPGHRGCPDDPDGQGTGAAAPAISAR